MTKKVAVLVGSLRKASFSKKLAKALTTLAPSSLEFQFIDIGNLPLYNQDLDDEGTPPTEWVTFRKHIQSTDALLFVTPEYNRSVPGVLKNAIDVGSRPYGKSVWARKPAAIVSNSPGAIGGFGSNQHLRQSFVFLDVPVLQAPEAYIGGVAELFDANNDISKEDTRQFLITFMKHYADWVDKFS